MKLVPDKDGDCEPDGPAGGLGVARQPAARQVRPLLLPRGRRGAACSRLVRAKDLHFECCSKHQAGKLQLEISGTSS